MKFSDSFTQVHFRLDFIMKANTICTQLRLLPRSIYGPREQSELGPYCLQYRLPTMPKKISRQEEQTTLDCYLFSNPEDHFSRGESEVQSSVSHCPSNGINVYYISSGHFSWCFFKSYVCDHLGHFILFKVYHSYEVTGPFSPQCKYALMC